MKLEGEETYILIFEEAKTEDSGHYVATVSNVEGSVTTEATLTVNSEWGSWGSWGRVREGG